MVHYSSLTEYSNETLIGISNSAQNPAKKDAARKVLAQRFVNKAKTNGKIKQAAQAVARVFNRRGFIVLEDKAEDTAKKNNFTLKTEDFLEEMAFNDDFRQEVIRAMNDSVTISEVNNLGEKTDIENDFKFIRNLDTTVAWTDMSEMAEHNLSFATGKYYDNYAQFIATGDEYFLKQAQAYAQEAQSLTALRAREEGLKEVNLDNAFNIQRWLMSANYYTVGRWLEWGKGGKLRAKLKSQMENGSVNSQIILVEAEIDKLKEENDPRVKEAKLKELKKQKKQLEKIRDAQGSLSKIFMSKYSNKMEAQLQGSQRGLKQSEGSEFYSDVMRDDETKELLGKHLEDEKDSLNSRLLQKENELNEKSFFSQFAFWKMIKEKNR